MVPQFQRLQGKEVLPSVAFQHQEGQVGPQLTAPAGQVSDFTPPLP